MIVLILVIRIMSHIDLIKSKTIMKTKPYLWVFHYEGEINAPALLIPVWLSKNITGTSSMFYFLKDH